MSELFQISSNPHIRSRVTTSGIMMGVLLALMPATGFGIYHFGPRAVLVIIVTVASCELTEFLFGLLRKKMTIGDLSAAVTGLLLAMNLPVTTPVWVVFIGALVAIGVAKMTFGGIGQNIFNPAITGRVFLLVSFPTYMTDWTVTKGFIQTDAVSGATLLGRYAEGGVEAIQGTDYLQTLFLNIGGSAGEISALALLLGFVYLLVRKVIKPWIPLSIFGTIALVSLIFWLIDPMTYSDPLFNLLTGGVILGACFMATDYVTSPMSTLGGVIYGIGIGFIVMMIRYFGAYPEGMSFAILIMNMCVPLLNMWFHKKKYGSK